MLPLDSLVTDLIFRNDAQFDQATFVEALGGPELAKTKKMLDPDMLDPRAEMEMSPSLPFRRRGERRLMILDDSRVLREDPQDPVVTVDLRAAKAELITICEKLPVRLGRLFALGSWGDAVLVSRSARDLRGISLLGWALDPTVDVDGKRRATQLSRAEFETKLLAFEKRLEELDDEEILSGLGGDIHFERHGELLVVDVLEPDGTWDLRKSMALETALAQYEKFSTFPGAPYVKPEGGKPVAKTNGTHGEQPVPAPVPAPEAVAVTPAASPAQEAAPAAAPLTTAEIAGGLVLVFPAARFDLDVAAALGKRDWDRVIRGSDKLSGAVRDRIQRDGASWVAPLEFLSEVFIDGKPLNRPAFDAAARPVADGVRALDVHFPRFGPVVLLDVAGKGRFVSSLSGHDADLASLVQK